MEILKSIWKCLSDLSLLQLIASLLIMFFSGTFIYLLRYIKSQWRFGRNLRRKIYFLKTSDDKNLQTQKDKLNSLGLFNLEKDIKDISSKLDVLQNLKNNAVYIVGYDEGYSYKQLFSRAVSMSIPVLIFANSGEIKKEEHWDLFNSYVYCDIANTTNRLAIILLNILKIT